MMHFLKLGFYLLQELVFDHKDEYNYKSARFNPKKVVLFFAILCSVVLNQVLAYRLVIVSKSIVEFRVQLKEACREAAFSASEVCTKFPRAAPSNVEKPTKKG